MKAIQSFEEKNSVKTLLIYILISMWIISFFLIWGQYNGEVTIDTGYNSLDVKVVNNSYEEVPVKIETYDKELELELELNSAAMEENY